MDLGLGELQGIQVTGRSGTWTGDATVTFDMTFGVKLGSASDLGIGGSDGVKAGDYDGDGIADATDEDDDGDGLPQASHARRG